MSPENDQDSASQRDFEQQAKADLRRSVAGITPKVRARLDEIVSQAIREAPAAPVRRPWRLAWPVGAGLAAAMLAIVLFRHDPPAPIEKPASAAADDLALLLNVENLDLLEQMEFYLWLDREPGVLPDAAATPPASQRS